MLDYSPFLWPQVQFIKIAGTTTIIMEEIGFCSLITDGKSSRISFARKSLHGVLGWEICPGFPFLVEVGKTTARSVYIINI
jgi:hypothetical protein